MAKNGIQESFAQIDERHQRIEKTSMAEAELEIRILQAGDARRNSYASQSNRCCFDPAVVEQLFTSGKMQAWQHNQALNRRVDGLHQVPATLVHTPGREEERRTRRSKRKGQPAANWVNQRQEAAIKVFRLVLCLILLGIRMQMEKAVEATSIHQEAGRIIEIDLAPQIIRMRESEKRRKVSKRHKEETARVGTR